MKLLEVNRLRTVATTLCARVRFLQRCLILGCGWLALCAHAAFPQAAVTMVVPGPAGSGTDQVARLLSDEFARLLAQPVVIENKAGASGSVGVQLLMRAKPDGYTIMIGHVSTHGIVPALRQPKPYDPVTDFTPIGAIGSSSNVLVVAPDQKINNLAEFISYGRRQPLLTYGSPGVSLSQHFDGYSFGKVFGFEMLHVPYKGTGPGITDLIGGRLTMMFATPPAVMSFVESGKLIALAQASAERQKAFLNIPTFKELGYPEIVNETWWGLFAPKGTPDEAISTLHQALLATLKSEKVKKGL
ncbi:MAG: Bug family tripartite tricarboxylate transporter substrate binding protein, partial [Zwartia sp.]